MELKKMLGRTAIAGALAVLGGVGANAHTNSVGFDLVDQGDGSCNLEWYYGSWHAGSLSPEGAFSLYTLQEGGDPTDVNDYTVEAYGTGGEIRNETNFFTWPGKDTANITLPGEIEQGSAEFYQQNGSTNTDIEDAGFRPGVNYFFTDGTGLTDISGQNAQTYSHQSATVATVQPGTYRGFYDGRGAWDNVQPPASTPAISATFEPDNAIKQGLVTVASGCRVFFGAVPTILIESFVGDNGFSTNDFVASPRSGAITGTLDSASTDTTTLKVTFDTTPFTLSDTELEITGDDWTLALPGPIDAGSHDVTATVQNNDGVAVSDTITLKIVAASIESIAEDDGLSQNDFRTSDTTLLVRGLLSASSASSLSVDFNSVVYTLDGGAPQDALLTNSGDDWLLDVTGTTLATGKYLVTATAVEGGETFTATQAIEIVNAPALPTFVSVTKDSGTGGDFITVDDTLLIQGTYEASATATFTIELGGIIYSLADSAELTSDGDNWTLDLQNRALGEGAFTAKATATNSGGWPSTAVQEILVVAAGDTDGDGLPNDEDPFPKAITDADGPEGDPVSMSIKPESVNSSCSIDGSRFDPDAPHPQPADLIALGRAVGFELASCNAGETVEISIDFGQPFPEGSRVHKVTMEGGWSTPIDAVINGSVITYSVTDGGELDADGTANGVIVDPVSTAVPPVPDSDGDGLPDDEDPFPNAVTDTGGTLENPVSMGITPTSVDSNCSIDESRFNPDAPHPEPEIYIPLGRAVSFDLSGCSIGETIEVSVDFGDPLPSGARAHKVTDVGWSEPISASIQGSVVTYSITDGGELDQDGTANGTIVDPISISMPSTAVPVSPLWMLGGLTLLMGLLGGRSRLQKGRRRSSASQAG